MNLLTTFDCIFASARYWLASITSHYRHARSYEAVGLCISDFIAFFCTYTAQVISRWRLSEACFDDPHSCEVTHDNFANSHDALNILRLLDKVREGFFQVVLGLPPAATWSRARHLGTGGQRPVRSRAQPWCITDTMHTRCTKLAHDNRSVEIST